MLSSLNPEEQTALEEAACAHYCGRYQDCDAIFASKLPPSPEKAIIALQRADMLTSQGLEQERVTLIKRTLASFPQEDEGAENLQAVRFLLEFMLIDAEYWAFGNLEAAAKFLPLVRNRLDLVTIENLSDTEVWGFTTLTNIFIPG